MGLGGEIMVVNGCVLVTSLTGHLFVSGWNALRGALETGGPWVLIQGAENNLSCRIAGQRLPEKQHIFADTGMKRHY